MVRGPKGPSENGPSWARRVSSEARAKSVAAALLQSGDVVAAATLFARVRILSIPVGNAIGLGPRLAETRNPIGDVLIRPARAQETFETAPHICTRLALYRLRMKLTPTDAK